MSDDSHSSSSDEEQLITNNNERTEEEIETLSEASSSRKKRKGKLKRDKFGRYHIRFKDRRAQRVYHIEAPNNVFFNDEMPI